MRLSAILFAVCLSGCSGSCQRASARDHNHIVQCSSGMCTVVDDEPCPFAGQWSGSAANDQWDCHLTVLVSADGEVRGRVPLCTKALGQPVRMEPDFAQIQGQVSKIGRFQGTYSYGKSTAIDGDRTEGVSGSFALAGDGHLDGVISMMTNGHYQFDFELRLQRGD